MVVTSGTRIGAHLVAELEQGLWWVVRGVGGGLTILFPPP